MESDEDEAGTGKYTSDSQCSESEKNRKKGMSLCQILIHLLLPVSSGERQVHLTNSLERN